MVSPILNEKWACAILIDQGKGQKPKVLIRYGLPFTWGTRTTNCVAFARESIQNIETFDRIPPSFGPQFLFGEVQTFRCEGAEEKLREILNPSWIMATKEDDEEKEDQE